MARNPSPLRYPGGKFNLYNLLSDIIVKNRLQACEYAEPFAGGCGLALELLLKNDISELHINDIDKGIWSFWHSVLFETDELLARISNTAVTVDEWYRQRQILEQSDADECALGFATLFLNRTSRSGIIKGSGIIGGKDQRGAYKIDCRFNKSDIAEKIKRISRQKDRISLYNKDALEFIGFASNISNVFLMIDPPYFVKGSQLYTSFYTHQDHVDLSNCIGSLDCNWVTTYDNVSEIKGMYEKHRQFEIQIQYSVQTKRKASEILIASRNLDVPRSLEPLCAEPTA